MFLQVRAAKTGESTEALDTLSRYNHTRRPEFQAIECRIVKIEASLKETVKIQTQ